MLSEFDDYFIHQTTDTIDHVANGDPRFQDRLYFNIHGRGGDFLVNSGIGAFPNQNVMDGYVIGVRGRRQYNLRVSRQLHHDRWKMHAGPFRLEILEPMKKWHISVDENNYGIAYDLVFTARTQPLEHHPIFQRLDNNVFWHQQHLQQSGTYDGWIRIGGELVDAKELWGSRDRTWGVRGPQPGSQLQIPTDQSGGAAAGLWMSAQFDDYAIHCWAGKDANGKNTHIDGAVARVGSTSELRHFGDWTFERHQGGRGMEPVAARVTFIDEDGKKEALEVKPVLSLNLMGTGYFKGFFGMKHGEDYVEGEAWDWDDNALRRDMGYMHGDVLSEFQHDGNVGYGVFESQILRRQE